MNVLPINNLSSYCIVPINAHKINNQQKNYNNCSTNLYHTYPVTNISFHANLSKIPSQLERFEGCLLGGAIGDAFGAPLEKHPMKYIEHDITGLSESGGEGKRGAEGNVKKKWKNAAEGFVYIETILYLCTLHQHCMV